MKAIILAGGQGGRFWPLSTKEKPKQFLNLYSDATMIQQTYQRFRYWLPEEKVFIVTTEKYLSLLKEQLPALKREQIILEPDQKDTAPCTAITALHFLQKRDDEPLVLAPSDQYIDDGDALKSALELAEEVAEKEHAFVTLGVTPYKPESGYGYIQTKINRDYDTSVLQAERFIEKPSVVKAKELLENNDVFWNSGIFICKPSVIADHFKRLQPAMWSLLEGNEVNMRTAYTMVPNLSIDYAILEKAEKVFTIPVTFLWDDVGVWTSLERVKEGDGNNNLTRGEVLTDSSHGCIIFTNKKAIILGVEDLIIANTENGLIVCHKSKEQEIKRFID